MKGSAVTVFQIAENLGEPVILSIAQALEDWLQGVALPMRSKSGNIYQDSLKLVLATNYRCLRPENILYEQTAQIQAVAKKLKLVPATVRILLRHFAWNSGNLPRRCSSNSWKRSSSESTGRTRRRESFSPCSRRLVCLQQQSRSPRRSLREALSAHVRGWDRAHGVSLPGGVHPRHNVRARLQALLLLRLLPQLPQDPGH